MLKSIIRTLLQKFIDDIDSDNCNITMEQQSKIISVLSNIANPDQRMSKIQACDYLGVSRAHNLMKFFTIEELTKSTTAQQKGIKNVPSKEEEQNLIALIENVLDPLREAYGKPIIVTSGYRCPALNRAVGGASTSQHMTGQAADIRTVLDTKSENKKLFDLAQKLKLPFDQLIDEHNLDWIHISYSNRNRRQVLTIK